MLVTFLTLLICLLLAWALLSTLYWHLARKVLQDAIRTPGRP